ncbi:TetR family transcriptional regulator [Winogradskyella sp. 3972H.M.0a.05]|uniref:TetR/AcrR family transcriptional regulator n=1 Tax=Winogradskyella sp. 3972H.M.0a.05 TaxID=2950277 RepID=UPI0033912DD0
MKHSEIKDHIVKTASQLFYKNGYNLTGINEIIAEAGIAKATLYNHFKSKEEVCLAYLQYKNDTFLNDIAEFCNAKRKGSGRVLGIFDFLKAFFKDSDFNGCWCIRTASEIPKDKATIRIEIQKQKENFIQLIESFVEDNLEIDNTKAIARQLYVLYEGAVAESYLHQQEWPITEARSIASKIIV